MKFLLWDVMIERLRSKLTRSREAECDGFDRGYLVPVLGVQ